jgi:hypothetical protein
MQGTAMEDTIMLVEDKNWRNKLFLWSSSSLVGEEANTEMGWLLKVGAGQGSFDFKMEDSRT